jgi:hypothetical protein
MRHIKMGMVLLAASAAFVAAQIDPPSRVGRLNYRDGAVSLRPTGINEWVDADLNRPLTTGDNIWVGVRRSQTPRIWPPKAIFCELTGRDFPHQDKWLPGELPLSWRQWTTERRGCARRSGLLAVPPV